MISKLKFISFLSFFGKELYIVSCQSVCLVEIVNNRKKVVKFILVTLQSYL